MSDDGYLVDHVEEQPGQGQTDANIEHIAANRRADSLVPKTLFGHQKGMDKVWG